MMTKNCSQDFNKFFEVWVPLYSGHSVEAEIWRMQDERTEAMRSFYDEDYSHVPEAINAPISTEFQLSFNTFGAATLQLLNRLSREKEINDVLCQETSKCQMHTFILRIQDRAKTDSFFCPCCISFLRPQFLVPWLAAQTLHPHFVCFRE
jgi:hypothetical protein